MRFYDDGDGSIISLSLLLLLDPDEDGGSHFADPSSKQSLDLWEDIKETIARTIQTEMSLDVEIIRTSWFHSRQEDRIDVCIIKTPTYDAWSPDQCTQLINHLEMDAEFSVPLKLLSNAIAFKEMISVDFRLSTSNQRYFRIVKDFAGLFNRRSSAAILHADDINENLGKSDP